MNINERLPYICRRGCCNVSVHVTGKRGDPARFTLNGEVIASRELARRLDVSMQSLLLRAERRSCLAVKRFERGRRPGAARPPDGSAGILPHDALIAAQFNRLRFGSTVV